MQQTFGEETQVMAVNHTAPVLTIIRPGLRLGLQAKPKGIGKYVETGNVHLLSSHDNTLHLHNSAFLIGR